MSYCRFSEGDVYAYACEGGVQFWVTGGINQFDRLCNTYDSAYQYAKYLRDECGLDVPSHAIEALRADALDESNHGDGSVVMELVSENAKLRELLEHLQPIDCDGNVLDIADKVHMLRSEYDGDHEWDDVVVELALAKWGGDRWIVRGSKGEAWACDCTKTGYDEDAYENSDDAEPIENPTLIEVENAKLRELVVKMRPICVEGKRCTFADRVYINSTMEELGIEVEDD